MNGRWKRVPRAPLWRMIFGRHRTLGSGMTPASLTTDEFKAFIAFLRQASTPMPTLLENSYANGFALVCPKGFSRIAAERGRNQLSHLEASELRSYPAELRRWLRVHNYRLRRRKPFVPPKARHQERQQPSNQN